MSGTVLASRQEAPPCTNCPVITSIHERNHQQDVLYFSDYKTHFSLQIWEENGGASYSPNVAYIYVGETLCYLCY